MSAYELSPPTASHTMTYTLPTHSTQQQHEERTADNMQHTQNLEDTTSQSPSQSHPPSSLSSPPSVPLLFTVDSSGTGSGRILSASNDVYDGSFYMWLRHGYGVQRWAGGEKYEGTWKHDKQWYGVFTDARGNRWKGDFIERKIKKIFSVDGEGEQGEGQEDEGRNVQEEKLNDAQQVSEAESQLQQYAQHLQQHDERMQQLQHDANAQQTQQITHVRHRETRACKGTQAVQATQYSFVCLVL